jgi:hypothetical protein
MTVPIKQWQVVLLYAAANCFHHLNELLPGEGACTSLNMHSSTFNNLQLQQSQCSGSTGPAGGGRPHGASAARPNFLHGDREPGATWQPGHQIVTAYIN